MPIGNGPCRTCGSNIAEVVIVDNDWLTQEQVKELCFPCYERMLESNITRIKKSYLLSKLESKSMEFYEVLYSGPENSKFNLGGHSLDPKVPKYFTEGELPFTPNYIKKNIPQVSIKKVELQSKPATAIEMAKVMNTKGIVWTGSSPKRTNEYGDFLRHTPRFDLTSQEIDILSVRQGFKVV